MLYSQISAVMSADDRQEIMDAIAIILKKMPFLMDLSPEEIRLLPKMGDKNQTFTRKALELALHNPDFLPRSFKLEEMQRDLELYDALRPIIVAIAQLQELLNDTSIKLGSEAYAAALDIYRYAKVTGSVGGLDKLVGDMGGRFAQPPKGDRPPSSAPDAMTDSASAETLSTPMA
ncbi:MAG: hypothetical protein ACFE0J_17015 [Elainellaceae cyanobacterium]